MTALKSSEKRLLTFFGVVAFLLVNLLGYSWLKKKSLVIERSRITLETRARELNALKARAPEAELKRAFLDQYVQPYADEATRETYLDQFINQEASTHDLTVRKNQPMPVKLEEHFHKSRYTAEVSGSWDDVFEFIFHLQAPKEFRFIPTIRLKSQKKEGATSDTDAADAVCTFEIEKWWSHQSAPAPERLAPEVLPIEQPTTAKVQP